jgi:DNA-binding NarL/FixJ family response regulator
LETDTWTKGETIALRPEEKQVLTLSAQGYTMKEIAELMLRSFDTVKFYRRQIFKKFNVQSITEALTFAINYGLI